jgi:hypothetical protein
LDSDKFPAFKVYYPRCLQIETVLAIPSHFYEVESEPKVKDRFMGIHLRRLPHNPLGEILFLRFSLSVGGNWQSFNSSGIRHQSSSLFPLSGSAPGSAMPLMILAAERKKHPIAEWFNTTGSNVTKCSQFSEFSHRDGRQISF